MQLNSDDFGDVAKEFFTILRRSVGSVVAVVPFGSGHAYGVEQVGDEVAFDEWEKCFCRGLGGGEEQGA